MYDQGREGLFPLDVLTSDRTGTVRIKILQYYNLSFLRLFTPRQCQNRSGTRRTTLWRRRSLRPVEQAQFLVRLLSTQPSVPAIYIYYTRVQDINPSGLWLWDRTLKPWLLSRSMTVMASCLVSLHPAFLYTI